MVIGIGQEFVEDGVLFFQRLRDTGVGYGQGNEHGAVLLDDRQELFALFRFTGNGIDQGPAGIDAQGRFHDFRRTRIDAEGQARYARHFVNGFEHHFLFINAVGPHVDIEDGRAVAFLFAGHGAYQVQLSRPQFSLELLFARRVDAFTNDLERAVELDFHDLPFRSQDAVMAGMRRFRRHLADRIVEGPDMVRRRPAAAADDMGTGFDEQFTVLSKFFRRRLVDRLVAIPFRQARIGLGNEGNRCIFIHLLDRFHHIGRPGRAVQADSGDAEMLQDDDSRFRRRPIEGTAVFFKSQRRHDGQVADFFDGQDAGSRFLEAHHGFDNEQVDAGVIQDLCLLAINIDQFLKGQVAHGIELLARHGHIAGDQGLPLGGFLGNGDQALVDGGQLVVQTVFGQFDAVPRKGRCIQNLAARFDEVALQVDHDLAVLQDPFFRADADRHARLLQIRPGRTVEHDDAAAEQVLEFFVSQSKFPLKIQIVDI